MVCAGDAVGAGLAAATVSGSAMGKAPVGNVAVGNVAVGNVAVGGASPVTRWSWAIICCESRTVPLAGPAGEGKKLRSRFQHLPSPRLEWRGVREALTLAYNFEWQNRVYWYGGMERNHSHFAPAPPSSRLAKKGNVDLQQYFHAEAAFSK